MPAATILRTAPVAIAAQPVLATAEENDPHPQYNFAYDIHDGLSGDSKSQTETRDGDVVRGQYTVFDADGLRRTVDYTADPINGFNAVVSRTPVAAAVVAAPAPTLAIARGPAFVKTSFASPVISYAH